MQSKIEIVTRPDVYISSISMPTDFHSISNPKWTGFILLSYCLSISIVFPLNSLPTLSHKAILSNPDLNISKACSTLIRDSVYLLYWEKLFKNAKSDRIVACLMGYVEKGSKGKAMLKISVASPVQKGQVAFCCHLGFPSTLVYSGTLFQQCPTWPLGPIQF